MKADAEGGRRGGGEGYKRMQYDDEDGYNE
jgi:hypothetical protein